jgi:hypothetical protein
VEIRVIRGQKKTLWIFFQNHWDNYVSKNCTYIQPVKKNQNYDANVQTMISSISDTNLSTNYTNNGFIIGGGKKKDKLLRKRLELTEN